MHLDRIIAFLNQIGLPVHRRLLPDETFLPGILVERGELVIDAEKLTHPGDLLHEAGHIAVMPPSERPNLNADLHSGPGEEMAAIAWSYAAAVHLELPLTELFHADGYKGGSASLIENFSNGRYLGVPLLQWYGLTRERDDGSGVPVYPRMSAWLRPQPVVS